MFLKLKSPVDAGQPDASDLENCQLYVDDDGDVCLVVQNVDGENRVICFHSGAAILMNSPPEVVRLITFDELEVDDE